MALFALHAPVARLAVEAPCFFGEWFIHYDLVYHGKGLASENVRSRTHRSDVGLGHHPVHVLIYGVNRWIYSEMIDRIERKCSVAEITAWGHVARA
jgi:hypothetical protein